MLNVVWGNIFFKLSFIFFKVERLHQEPLERPAVYCLNHTSYLDIPMLFVGIPGYFKVIGKSELNKVPLFGYMFKNLYISLNRKGKKSIKESIDKSKKAVDEGHDIVIFPEGTIPDTTIAPKMIKFKNGPFIIAIEKQIPIIPVTTPFNWKYLPDAKFPLRMHKLKMIFHEPIPTKGLTLDDLEELKQKTYNVMHESIKVHNPGMKL